jgi:hypothetical protein
LFAQQKPGFFEKPGFLDVSVGPETRLGKNRVSSVGEKPGFSGARNPVGKKPGFERWAKNRVSTVGKKPQTPKQC